MSPGAPDLFGRPLAPDPKVALPTLPAQPLRDGPTIKTQFVIEIAGPTPVAAGAAATLLQEPWYSSLGSPKVFVLKPGLADWEQCVPTNQGVLDSICLAWDYLSDRGKLTTPAAAHLHVIAGQFAHSVQRQAFPLTPTGSVDAIGRALAEVRDSLDTGLSIAVLPRSGLIAERELWIGCSALGLTFSPAGSFDWVCPRHPAPILSVTPIGETESFSLGAVQRGAFHQGVTVGFRLATCPAATIAAEAAFRCADYLASVMPGVAVDDEHRPLDKHVRNELKRNLDAGIGLLHRAGIQPGSPEAMSLFR